jgi:hypothetical protein
VRNHRLVGYRPAQAVLLEGPQAFGAPGLRLSWARVARDRGIERVRAVGNLDSLRDALKGSATETL